MTSTKTHPNLYYYSLYVSDVVALAMAMGSYRPRDYVDIDWRDHEALLREAMKEYDATWRGQEGVFESYADAKAEADGRTIVMVSLELIAVEIANLAWRAREGDRDDADIAEAEQLPYSDIIYAVRRMVDERGLRG